MSTAHEVSNELLDQPARPLVTPGLGAAAWSVAKAQDAPARAARRASPFAGMGCVCVAADGRVRRLHART